MSAAFKMARGKYVLLVEQGVEAFVRDRSFVQKLLEVFHAKADLDALVLDRRPAKGVGYELTDDEIGCHKPVAVAWRADRQIGLPDPIALRVGDCVGSIVRALRRADAVMEWRSDPRYASEPKDGRRESRAMLARLPRSSVVERDEWDRVARSRRRLREGDLEPLPGMMFLCRHREHRGDIRVVTASQDPPDGFVLEATVGLVHAFSPPGTAWVVLGPDGRIRRVPRGETGSLGSGDRLLGAVEVVPFLLQDPLQVGALRTTGHHVLVNGADDPLLSEVDILETVGFVEPWPLRPRRGPAASQPFGLAGLVRGIDRRGRRHVYSVGSLPVGELVGELGALHLEAQSDSVPVWVTDDGRILIESYDPTIAKARVLAATRWALAPARWWGAHHLLPRSRAIGRRLLQIRRYTGSDPVASRPSGPPDGYLFRADGRSRLPLYAALHPITGDQLLTRFPLEAQDMGYTRIERLGYVLAAWPVTGRDDRTRPTVPWASRFGLEARWQ